MTKTAKEIIIPVRQTMELGVCSPQAFFFGMSWEMHRCGPIEGVRSEENWDVDRGRMVSAGPQKRKRRRYHEREC